MLNHDNCYDDCVKTLFFMVSTSLLSSRSSLFMSMVAVWSCWIFSVHWVSMTVMVWSGGGGGSSGAPFLP